MRKDSGIATTAPPDIHPSLSKISLLQGLAPEALRHLSLHLHVRQIRRNQWILHKGNSGDQLFFLLTGRLQVIDITYNGKEVGLSFLNPGDYFGELSVIDGLPRTSSVQAIVDSEIAMLPRHIALDLMLHHPAVVERLLQSMARTIRNANVYRGILSIPSANQRVYALLERMTTEAPGGLHVIDPLPTQQEVAIMVNTSRETVSRALQALLQSGVLEKDLRRLIVRQPDLLHAAAAPHEVAEK